MPAAAWHQEASLPEACRWEITANLVRAKIVFFGDCEFDLKSKPRRVQNESKKAPDGIKMAPKWIPGGLLERLGLLEASWSAPGGLLESSCSGSGSKKSALGRLLAAPREIPREVSAILGAKRLPKMRPRELQIELKR